MSEEKKICKAEGCGKAIAKHRIYCSASCRTRTTNKLYKDYTKDALKKREKTLEAYAKRKPKCKSCNKALTFKQRHNKFCSNSCSATFHNKGAKQQKETKEKISKTLKERWLKEKLEKGEVPYKICPQCSEQFLPKVKKRKFCSRKCASESRKKGEGIVAYRTAASFKFNVYDFPERFNLDLVKEHGWYSPSNKRNNLGGVSRDHMFSVAEGYKRGVDPEILAHPANCRLMLHNKNISKNSKCVITLEELLERIRKW